MEDDPLRLIADIEAQASHAVTETAAGKMIWRIWGDGPPVVLLHGGHGSWKHWIRNIPALTGICRLYVPNLPGMGGSDPAGETMEELAAAVATGVEQLGISVRYSLGGFSLGSMVAAYMLDAHADRLRHLFLVGTSGFGKVDVITGALRRWQETKDPTERRSIHAYNLSQLMLHKPESIDALAVEIQKDNAENTLVNNRKAAMASNMAHCLERHPGVPVIAIWGREDVLICRHLEERIAYLAARRPPGQAHVFSDVGHWVQFEAADEVNAVLLQAIQADRDPVQPSSVRSHV